VDLKGNKKTLTESWLGQIQGLAWSSSNDEILFAAAAYGFTNSLYAVSRSGRQRLIAHLSGSFLLLDVAPDGRLLMAHGVISNALFYQPTGEVLGSGLEEEEHYCGPDAFSNSSSCFSAFSKNSASLLMFSTFVVFCTWIVLVGLMVVSFFEVTMWVRPILSDTTAPTFRMAVVRPRP